MTLDMIEQRIWNAGERLIPGVTHDTAEVVRHKSSYLFFRKVIEKDLLLGSLGRLPIRILDIGCGVGHGAQMLAEIPGAVVTGVDCQEEAIVYARLHYGRENITYVVADGPDFIRTMPEFEYVVSRHSLEHIVDGIAVGATCRFGVRLMVNVPFMEAEGNPHHLVHFIREDSFEKYPNKELFYESLEGVTFCDLPAVTPNSIVCVSSRTGLPRVAGQLTFPSSAWHPEFLQARWLEGLDQQGNFNIRAEQQSAREAELNSRESNVTNREADLAGRESRVSLRESELTTRESHAAGREADLSGREARVSLRESELANRESHAAGREADLSSRETCISLRESELANRESHAAGREAEFSGREAHVSARESELANRESHAAGREAELSGREARVSLRESELANRESQFAKSEAALSDRARELHAHEREVAGLEAVLTNRETQLTEQRTRLDELVQGFESRVMVRAYRKIKNVLQ
jgi:hypothetical protein